MSLALPDVGYGLFPRSPSFRFNGLGFGERFAAGGKSEVSLSTSDSVPKLVWSKSCSLSPLLPLPAEDCLRLRLDGLFAGLEFPLT